MTVRYKQRSGRFAAYGPKEDIQPGPIYIETREPSLPHWRIVERVSAVQGHKDLAWGHLVPTYVTDVDPSDRRLCPECGDKLSLVAGAMTRNTHEWNAARYSPPRGGLCGACARDGKKKEKP